MKQTLKTLFTIACLCASLAQAGERVALVIGNSDYRHLGKLNNVPINDATGVAESLEKLGFKVTLKNNLSFNELRKAVINFRQQHINKNTELALMYYAGHGIGYNSKNYFLPVEIDLQRCDTIESDALSVKTVLDHLSEGKAKTTAVIFDACRNVAKCSRGLNEMYNKTYRYPNTLVAYSTKEGEPAKNGYDNSPYTAQLIKQLNTPNLTLFSILNGIDLHDQQPEINTAGRINNLVLNTGDGTESDYQNPTNVDVSITDIQVTLPSQLIWKTTQADNKKTVYLPTGYDLKDSPIHVVKIKSPMTNSKLLALQAIEPLKQNCEKFSMINFPTHSQYSNKSNYKVVCSQIKGLQNGLIKYITVFSDGVGSQLLSSEVKTPIINDKGLFIVPQTADGFKVAKMTVNMVRATEKMVSEVLVCTTGGICQ